MTATKEAGVSERGAVAIEQVAAQIVDGIIEDLQGRAGLGDEWDYEIDEAIRRVIRAEWISIAKEALERKEPANG